MNIILIGLRGSGKTKVGKILAEELNLTFIDLDEEITQAEKLTIPEIITQKGWDYFRAQEKLHTKNLINQTNTVISTGGGTILYPENSSTLKKIGTIIYLHTTPEICATRIANSKNRPQLTNETTLLSEMQQLYIERHDLYTTTADHIFNRTDDPNLDAKTIIKTLLTP